MNNRTCSALLSTTIVSLALWDCSAAQPAGNASATSASLQLSVLHAQLQQDLSELRINESVQQKAETSDTQRDALQTRAEALRADIARLQRQINGVSR